jgi:hypothetical protein
LVGSMSEKSIPWPDINNQKVKKYTMALFSVSLGIYIGKKYNPIFLD